MSWGGTMFEYLMPQLLMRSFPGTLLDQSCRASVRAADRVRPAAWRAVGHFGIGLRLHRSGRQLSVPRLRRAGARPEARAWPRPRVAPYATALASVVSPGGGGGELRGAGPRKGLEARYGFYESIDYNPRNRGDDVRPRRPAAVIVRAYFAHHQGMSLVALANVVCQDVFVARFHADPRIQATELLLQERVPREAILSEPRPAETAPRRRRCRCSRHAGSVAAHAQRAHAFPLERPLHDGGDQRRRRLQHVARLAVTRRREDPTPTPGAHFIYLRDPWSGRVWSATHQPDLPARPTSSRRRSISTRSRSAAATATSRRSSRSPCRPRTTWRCGG